MTPEELWKHAVHGSQEAWKEVYAFLGPKLYQFFLKNTSNPDVAMDKSQEVFEKLYNHREAFTEGNLKTWVFRIARNLLIDYWRRKGRRAECFGEDAPEIPDPLVNVEEGVINRLHRDDMIRLIDETLPQLIEEDRLIIGLVYLGGLSIPELAQVMEAPLGTAKTWVRQARLRLDRLMAEKLHLQQEGVRA
jgi:RNA polymerase sigma-70 factor (ECF subfamily)